MEVIIGIYNNCRIAFQQYGSPYSGIYLSVVLVLIVSGIKVKNKYIEGVVRYCIYCICVAILIGCMVFFIQLKEFDINKYIYMIIPPVIINILLCIYLGQRYKINKYLIVLFFSILIICEASVPMCLSITDSFTFPGSNGKYSSEITQVVKIVGDDSVVIPKSLENEYRSLKWHGTTTEEIVYDDGENYITEIKTADAFNLGIQFSTEYVVIRVVNILDDTGEDSIKDLANINGYEVIDSVGKYMIAKKI